MQDRFEVTAKKLTDIEAANKASAEMAEAIFGSAQQSAFDGLL